MKWDIGVASGGVNPLSYPIGPGLCISYPKCLGPDVFQFLILEYLDMHNEIHWGCNPNVYKHEIHLCYIVNIT